MRRCAIALFLVLSTAPYATAARRQASELLQSRESARGFVLSIDGRRAKLTSGAATQRGFRLRRGERVLGFSELETGWVATGIQLLPDRLDLWVVANRGRGPRRIHLPAERTGAVRTGPTAIVDGDGLAGLAWLEGDLDNLAVRAGVLDEGGLTRVETVSAAPPSGSQTGLTAAVLPDGSWLLAWSRFDGNDDEIYWTRRPAGGRWQAPRRLTRNATPDVTPHLLARGPGAVLAWSGLRDEYEVFTAAFDGDGWTAPRSLGIPGTLTPAFRQLQEADYLLVRNAWPGGWTAFRLDGQGRPSDFASVAEESRRPPVLRSRPGRGLAFEWPHLPEPKALAWEPMP